MVPSSPSLILVVEDDIDIRDALLQILEGEGYATASASNGEEALTYLRGNPNPSLILLDLMMPVKDGTQFREEQRLNPDWAKIPVIIMSADVKLLQKQGKLGASDYLKKPVDLDEILKSVERNLLKN